MNGSLSPFQAFVETWRETLRPEGLLEIEAFDDYVRALWHKREVNAALDKTPGYCLEMLFDDRDARRLDRLHRYARDFERRAAQHLRELRRLQAERARRQAPASAPVATTSNARPKPSLMPPPGLAATLGKDLLASLQSAPPVQPQLDSGPPSGS